MVSIEHIAASAASAWRDLRTAMARAMLRALGIDPAAIAPERAPLPGSVVSAERYGDLAECFENSESPMDGRR